MLVATRNLVVRYGKEEVRLIAGRTHLVDGHDIAKAHPSAFKHVEGTSRFARERIIGIQAGRPSVAPIIRGGESATATNSGKGLEKWRILTDAATCSISERQSSTRIRMSAESKEKIFDVIRQTTDVDGLECGGLLFGPPPTADLIQVLGASGHGPLSVRKRESIAFDPVHSKALVDEAASVGWVCLGEHHSHPPTSDGRSSRALSERDLAGASRLRQQHGQSRYVSIIAVRDQGRWDLQAWVISEGIGRDRAEQATL